MFPVCKFTFFGDLNPIWTVGRFFLPAADFQKFYRYNIVTKLSDN